MNFLNQPGTTKVVIVEMWQYTVSGDSNISLINTIFQLFIHLYVFVQINVVLHGNLRTDQSSPRVKNIIS